MEMICGKQGGFCAGVRNAVTKAEEIVRKNECVYCLGEIVHNERVAKKLEDMGMITKENIDEIPENSKLIIRAHGAEKSTYEKAKEKNIEIFDLTCPKVLEIKNSAQNKTQDNFIILIGKKNHPETIGTISFCGENSNIMENEEDTEKTYEKFKNSKLNKIYIISQTTFSSNKFDILVDKIKEIFKIAEIQINKTICNSTEKRQEEAERISKEVNKMIIIGGKNSSNTKELFKIAEKNCKESFLVQNVEDIKKEIFSSKDKIGIMAGASTPQESINEIIEYIRKRSI